MRQPHGADQGQVLLHANPGQGGQILGRHEMAIAPVPAARQVDERAPDPLAGLAGDAGIAEALRHHEGIQRAVALINDHRPRGGQRRHARLQRARALHRLLDEKDGGAKPLQPGLRLHGAPEGEGAFGILILLIAVQRRVVAMQPVQHGGDAAEPVHIRFQVAADLQLPIGVAIGGGDLLQRLGQAIAHALLLVGCRDRVHQAHRVARMDAARLGRPGQHRREVEAGEVRDGRMRRHAAEIGAQPRIEGKPLQPQQRVKRRAVPEGAAEARHQRVQPLGGAGGDMGGIAIGVMAEGGVEARGERLRLRDFQRAAELMLVVGVAERRVLVEPFGGQCFGCPAPALAAGFILDAGAHQGLDAVAHRDHAEAEGHAQREGPFEALGLGKAEFHAASPSSIPRR